MKNQESNQKDRILENETELMKNIPALAKIEEKDIISTLFSFYKSLLPEEVFILQFLYNNGPSTIRRIRREYAIEIFKSRHISHKELEFVVQDLTKKGFKLPEAPISAMKIALKTGDFEHLRVLSESEFEFFINFVNAISSRKVHSYYTLKNILDDLEGAGVISKRELKERRAETVYFLSPKFSKLCSIAVSYLESIQEPTSIEREVYKFITGKEFPLKKPSPKEDIEHKSMPKNEDEKEEGYDFFTFKL
jgi:DNA-binding MarR family transcriptional regulator